MKNVSVHNARDLMMLSSAEIWNIPDTNMQVKFDDGVLDTKARYIILSHYLWWPHREWKDTPLLKEHCFSGRFTKSSILDYLNITTWCAYDHSDNVDVEYLGILTRKSITTIYNDFTYRLEAYVTGLSALDLLQIADHPRVRAVNDELRALDLSEAGVLSNSELYISAAQEEISDVLKNDKSLKGNRQYELAASHQVDLRQQLQLAGPRGHVSDIDSNIFKYPIMAGYAEGLTKLIQFSMDSRAAAKALIFTQHPLQETEYTNRELQLLASVLSNLHVDDDCGTTDLLPWLVSKGNINILTGLHYSLSDIIEEQELHILTKESGKALIGKVIHLRTAATCKHVDEYGICGICFGELRHQIPRYTNIGHASTTELCAKVSQDVLSVKHLDGTAITTRIKLQGHDVNFLAAYNTKQQIGINPNLSDYVIRLHIPKDGMENLANVFNVNKVSKLIESKTTAMTEVCLELEDEDGDLEYHYVIVGEGGKKSYFTTQFLKYVKEKSYTVIDDKTIVITLEDWDITKPIWQIPRRHASALEFLRDVKSDIKNTAKGRKSSNVLDNELLGAKILALSDLVSGKFSIHITHLATIIRTTMTRDSKGYDYRIPNSGSSVELETYRKLIINRSLGAASGYQELGKMFYSPHSYINKVRPYSHFDELFNIK